MAIVNNATLNALRTGMQKRFDQQFKAMQAESFYKRVATIVPSDDAMETYGWLGDFPEMREWIGDRVAKDMKENAYQIVNKLWEATVRVKRTSIEDDKFGTLMPRVDQMAHSAARQPERIIAQALAEGHAKLCYDGQNFFDTDHPVYPSVDGTGTATTVSNYDDGGGAPGPAWYLLCTKMPLRPVIFQERKKPEFESKTNPGTSDGVFTSDEYEYGIRARNNGGYGFWQCAYKSHAALTSENLEAAEAAMMSFMGDGDIPLGIMPDMLVVPPKLKAAGRRLLEVRTETGGGDNPLFEEFELLTVPWLAEAS